MNPYVKSLIRATFCVATLNSTQAASLNFERSQTLSGWHERVHTGKVRIKFSHVGQGLAFRNGDKLQGFAIAGADKVFHWAEAAIDGTTVVVHCAAVPQPSAVWYAWAEDRRWANLFNKDGLPAIPFHTDL